MQAVLKDTITYRVFEENDIDKVLQLWKDHSGWGEITREQFYQWNINNPFEPSLIILAIDEGGSVVGQKVFIPSRMYVAGKEIKTMRIVAPILHEKYRLPDLRNPGHPVISMLKAGTAEAAKRGYQFVYSFPAQGWLALSRLLPNFLPYAAESASFDCAGISLKNKENLSATSSPYFVTIANGFSIEYDELWENAKHSFPVKCAVVRNAKWLHWKYGEHFVLELRNISDNKLKGYCAIKKNSGLIEDIFAVTPAALKNILKQTVNVFHYLNPERPDINFDVLKIMMTPPVVETLKDLDYHKENFRFAYSSLLLDKNLDKSEFLVQQWYMMPND